MILFRAPAMILAALKSGRHIARRAVKGAVEHPDR